MSTPAPTCVWCIGTGYVPVSGILCRTCHGTGKQGSSLLQAAPAPRFTERDREIAHAHFFYTGDRGKAVELAAASREDVLRRFDELAKEWSTQLEWSLKHTPYSEAANGVQACRNKLEEVIRALRGGQ